MYCSIRLLFSRLSAKFHRTAMFKKKTLPILSPPPKSFSKLFYCRIGGRHKILNVKVVLTANILTIRDENLCARDTSIRVNNKSLVI